MTRRAALQPAPRPQQPVLFYNRRSGGGKADRFGLPAEASARGIEPCELAPGTDLAELVRDAVARGADALAMAGGDGSQAIVAASAAEHSLPYVCVPAGTRNHFALDLGVDCDDVVGALDALVDGVERVVDLAEVNGRSFVNNVSLGLYGEAVQRTTYRNAKLRTLLATIPDADRGEEEAPFRWTDPDGNRFEGNRVILVSNNPYRLDVRAGQRMRQRLDEGLLGVLMDGERADSSASSPPRPREVQAWSAPTFTVEADRRVPAGIDGEAAQLEPPLAFRTRPRVLKVRIALGHPGARG